MNQNLLKELLSEWANDFSLTADQYREKLTAITDVLQIEEQISSIWKGVELKQGDLIVVLDYHNHSLLRNKSKGLKKKKSELLNKPEDNKKAPVATQTESKTASGTQENQGTAAAGEKKRGKIKIPYCKFARYASSREKIVRVYSKPDELILLEYDRRFILPVTNSIINRIKSKTQMESLVESPISIYTSKVQDIAKTILEKIFQFNSIPMQVLTQCLSPIYIDNNQFIQLSDSYYDDVARIAEKLDEISANLHHNSIRKKTLAKYSEKLEKIYNKCNSGFGIFAPCRNQILNQLRKVNVSKTVDVEFFVYQNRIQSTVEYYTMCKRLIPFLKSGENHGKTEGILDNLITENKWWNYLIEATVISYLHSIQFKFLITDHSDDEYIEEIHFNIECIDKLTSQNGPLNFHDFLHSVSSHIFPLFDSYIRSAYCQMNFYFTEENKLNYSNINALFNDSPSSSTHAIENANISPRFSISTEKNRALFNSCDFASSDPLETYLIQWKNEILNDINILLTIKTPDDNLDISIDYLSAIAPLPILIKQLLAKIKANYQHMLEQFFSKPSGVASPSTDSSILSPRLASSLPPSQPVPVVSIAAPPPTAGTPPPRNRKKLYKDLLKLLKTNPPIKRALLAGSFLPFPPLPLSLFPSFLLPNYSLSPSCFLPSSFSFPPPGWSFRCPSFYLPFFPSFFSLTIPLIPFSSFPFPLLFPSPFAFPSFPLLSHPVLFSFLPFPLLFCSFAFPAASPFPTTANYFLGWNRNPGGLSF